MSAPYSYPAPFRGWVETDNKPGGASVLQNWLPTSSGCRVRGGCQAVSVLPTEATALFAYDDGGPVQKLFGATASGIFEADPLDGSAATSAVSGMLGGDWITATFRTIGDHYLLAVNGFDDVQMFDGSAWTVPTLTVPSGTAAPGAFSYVFVFKSRVYFVQANSARVLFLPVGQIGGEMLDLDLTGVFQRGGHIVFGTTWSSDTGAGLGDRMVLMSDMGEICVFEGSDPADPSAWSIVGRYEASPPLGKRAHVRIGGDVMIATVDGLVTLSGIVSLDGAALQAASLPIQRSWSAAAGVNRTGWQIMRWDAARVLLVMRPSGNGWGMALDRGAWFEITGWDMRHAAIHQGRLYFVGDEGVIRQGDTTGQDDGAPVVARYRGVLEPAPRGGIKVVQLARATFHTEGEPSFALQFVSGARDDQPPVPAPWPATADDSRWDIGLWDQMRWASLSSDLETETSFWEAMGCTGELIAPDLTVVSDALLPAVCELVGVDAMIEGGGVVV